MRGRIFRFDAMRCYLKPGGKEVGKPICDHRLFCMRCDTANQPRLGREDIDWIFANLEIRLVWSKLNSSRMGVMTSCCLVGAKQENAT